MTSHNIISAEALSIMRSDGAVIVDVRTPKEWSEVGKPYIKGKKTIFLSLLQQPDMSPNPHFVSDFMMLDIPHSKKLLFICKSGGRSGMAAKICSELGYECYNIADGFEGNELGIGWKNLGSEFCQK